MPSECTVSWYGGRGSPTRLQVAARFRAVPSQNRRCPNSSHALERSRGRQVRFTRVCVPNRAAGGRGGAPEYALLFIFAHETAGKGAIYFCSNRDETRRLYAPWRTGVRRDVYRALGRGGGPEWRPFARVSAGRGAVDTGKRDTHGACERAGNGSRTLYVRDVGIREACAAQLGDGRWGWRGRDPSSSARCPTWSGPLEHGGGRCARRIRKSVPNGAADG